MPRFFRAHRLQPFALGHLLSCAQEFFATSTSNSSSDQNPSMCYQITHSQFVAPILFAASTTVGHWTFNKNPLFLQQIHHKKDGATNRLPYCNKKKILWCSNTKKTTATNASCYHMLQQKGAATLRQRPATCLLRGEARVTLPATMEKGCGNNSR